MGPMTREMFYYFNLMRWCYWVCGDKFTVKIAGEEYAFQRCGLRHWVCERGDLTKEFMSQREVIFWLGSEWDDELNRVYADLHGHPRMATEY